MSRVANRINASTVPLGSRFEATASSPTRKTALDRQSAIATRDPLNSKVVGKSTVFKTAGKKHVPNAVGSMDHVGVALGSSTTPTVGGRVAKAPATPTAAAGSPSKTRVSTTAGGASTPVTANRAFQQAMKQGELDTGARKKQLKQAGGITSTAGLAGSSEGTNAGAPTNSVHDQRHVRKHFAGVSGSAETGAVLGGAKVSIHRDPTDARFTGAAGVPSGRVKGVSVTTSTGDQKPIKHVLGKNTTVKGAAGEKSEDVEKKKDRFVKKGVVAEKKGASYDHVMAGSDPAATGETTAEIGLKMQQEPIHTTKKLVPGRSNISPYRRAADGTGSAAAPQRGVSPVRDHVLPKPFATDDQPAAGKATAGSSLGPNGRPVSATRVRPSTSPSLLGVFKADASLIQQRKANTVAPWEKKVVATTTQRSHAVGFTSVSRRDNMGGVFTTGDAHKGAPTGAAVGSSNIMSRVSPCRAATTTRVAVTPAPGAGGDEARASSARRLRVGVVPPSQQGRDTRPVWKQTPRLEPVRSGINTSLRRSNTAAPYATD